LGVEIAETLRKNGRTIRTILELLWGLEVSKTAGKMDLSPEN
jgi:hypothetical protein